MTPRAPNPEQEYLITEEQLTELESRKNYRTGQKLIYASIYQRGKDIRSRPYNPQADQGKILDKLDERIMERICELMVEYQKLQPTKSYLVWERRLGIVEVLDMIAEIRSQQSVHVSAPDADNLQESLFSFKAKCCEICESPEPFCSDSCGVYQCERDAAIRKDNRGRILDDIKNHVKNLHKLKRISTKAYVDILDYITNLRQEDAPHSERYVLVNYCMACPHFLDLWSFGEPAAKCGNSQSGNIITPEEKKTFPDWCPLPKITHSTQQEAPE